MKKEKSNRYERLKLWELQTIHVMQAAGKSLREIAQAARRSKSAVSKALNLYRHPNWQTWLRLTALEKAKYVYDEMQRNRWRSRQKGHIRDYEVRKYVIEKLADDNWSPEAISASLEQDFSGRGVSAKTIYTFIKRERKDLVQYLYERGKARRQRVMHRRGRFKQAAPAKRSIHERPEVINNREEVGHWEADTIITTRRGTKAILSLRERKTRKRIYRLIPDLKSETVLAYLRAILESLPPHMRKSITFDNGSEFAISTLICLETLYPGLKLYFCDAYASWQKGSVENSNRDLRWYYPKGTDFGRLSSEEIRRIESKINARPMKCHKYQKPCKLFEMALALNQRQEHFVASLHSPQNLNDWLPSQALSY